MNRSARTRLRRLTAVALAPVAWLAPAASADGRPNILVAVADDWSWPHASAAGDPVVQTPAFDRVAREGVLFTNAYCAAPSCTPSRGAIFTGQHIYRLGPGGNLWSTLPASLPVYPDLLADAGYRVGYTGKGWGPGSVEAGGRTTNPAGPIRTRSLGEFLDADDASGPFCFWFGSHDPHRSYVLGSGEKAGMDPDRVQTPACLPDVPEIRSDICDYYAEVQRFDRAVGEMLSLLEERGLLENTLIIVTSDNGMPFPRAKANLYDLGTRMPLAVSWRGRIPGGRTVTDFVSLTDLAPTILEAAGVEVPEKMTGRSLKTILLSDADGRVEAGRDFVVTARERHAWVRAGGVGYPARAIRTDRHLYIRNHEPGRWPGGDPPFYGDIDDRQLRVYTPSKEYMMTRRDEPAVAPLFLAAFGKRPAEELYDLERDPGQLDNKAADPAFEEIRKQLAERLRAYLVETGDPRATDGPILWDTYDYVGDRQFKPRPDAPIRDEGP